MKTNNSYTILYFIFFILLAMFIGNGSAQSISEQLKHADCHFEIYYEDESLDVIKQMITKRSTIIDHYDGDYAYNAYYLEFVYQKDIQIKKRGRILSAKFFSASDILLMKTILSDDEWNGGGDQKYFSFSLLNIPVFVLDDTYKIVLTRK